MRKNRFFYLLTVILLLAGLVTPLRAVEPVEQYTLSFFGKNSLNNNPITLTKITLSNLTQGCDTTFTSTTFQLKVFAQPLGIETIDAASSMQVRLVSANPFVSETEVEVTLPFAAPLSLTLFGIEGRIQQRYAGHFDAGIHRFSVEPGNKGISFLSVSNEKSRLSLKLIKLTGGNAAKITYALSSKTENLSLVEPTIGFRSTTAAPFVYYEGDQLQLIGYANGYANSSLYDVPVKNGNYTFYFSDPFYRIVGYPPISCEKPSFVDVLFSVKDRNNKGVANLSNEDFLITENGASLGGTSENFAYIRKMNTIPYKIQTVLVLDNSRSLSATDLNKMKEAAIKLVNHKVSNQEIAVYSFSETVTLLQNFTTDTTLLVQAISGMQRGGNSTDLYGAYITGVQRFTIDVFTTQQIYQGCMVVFTDGDDTQASHTLSQAIGARGGKRVYMVGFGDLDASTLSQLASSGSYFPVNSTDQLEQVFLSIQEDILNYANSFYWLNYMSPKRNISSVTLKLGIKGNTNTASDSYYQGNFNASNFEAANGGVYIDPYLNGNGKEGYPSTYTFTNATTDRHILSAKTYWAVNMPSYRWTSSDERIAQIKPIPQSFNKAELIFPENNPGGTVTITVHDDANWDEDSGIYYERSVQARAFTIPKLTTHEVTGITYHTAVSGINITDNGGTPITHIGLRYGFSPTELIYATISGPGPDNLALYLYNLQAGTTYYVQAYAINQMGTGYGEIKSFRTPDAIAPRVSTGEVTNITYNTAAIEGIITDNGGYPVTQKGLQYGVSTTGGVIYSTFNGSGDSNFTGNLTGLQAGTTYRVKAYATNQIGTGYGEWKNFRTPDAIAPTVTTGTVTDITSNAAKCMATVSHDGGAPITEQGICWSSTTNNPTVADNKATGSNVTLSGLSFNTTYYVRAYAVNSAGTGYGGVVSFRTLAIAPIVVTGEVTGITYYTAVIKGSITNNGGYPVTQKVLICGVSPVSPTGVAAIAFGSGDNDFTFNLTGLQAGTTYYVQAYAQNQMGTGYGEIKSFRTLDVTVPAVTTGTVTDITYNTAVCGGNIADNGGYPVTQKGLRYGLSLTGGVIYSTFYGSGDNDFTGGLTNLQAGTTYYVQAYATNQIGTGYGEWKNFRTPDAIAPGVITGTVTGITGTSAECTSTVSYNGGATVTEQGICWSNGTSNPTVANSKATGSNVTLSDLSPNTTYYARAYAVNSAGTGYGEVKSFRTPAIIPVVTTGAVTDITSYTAVCAATVTYNGGATVTEQGICWSNTTSNPTVADNKATGSSLTLSGLSFNTVYYVRAYAVNSAGTAYGELRSFRTLPIAPVVTTGVVNITATSAVCTATVTNNGGAAVTEQGICWSTTDNPTTADSKATGSNVTLNGLSPNTIYYARAYAVNSAGTGYGEVKNFQTPAIIPVVTTGAVTDITSYTAVCTATVTNNGGATITEQGICWSNTTSNPTVADNKATGSSVTLSGLSFNTTYYVRAYAVNSAGTGYGELRSFQTLPIAPVVTTGEVTDITYNAAKCTATVSHNGGASVTEQGICWSTTDNPTTADSKATGSNVTLGDLSFNTTYYVRAYAVNSVETGYGEVKSFRTPDVIAPTVTTGSVNITYNTAKCTATVSDNGGAPVTEQGICWSTTDNPTVADSKATGSNVTLNGLSFNTTYYVRAYAVNIAGTGYGDVVNFTTVQSVLVTTLAEISNPTGVAVDASGNVYVADQSNHRIYKISPQGAVTTLAGSGTSGFVDWNGANARFNNPSGVAVDASGNVYVADASNHSIRKISPQGAVTTLAGNGTTGFADGNGANARFDSPSGVAVDASGNVYVADRDNQRIRKISPQGAVTTLAGSTQGFADGNGANARFSNPYGVAVDASGNVYVAEWGNSRIRKISPQGAVTTLAGSEYGFADGNGANAMFRWPSGVAVDASGNAYVADYYNNSIREISPQGVVTTLAGSGIYGNGFADGNGANARFYHPVGVAVDASGNVYVADTGNHRIRKITFE